MAVDGCGCVRTRLSSKLSSGCCIALVKERIVAAYALPRSVKVALSVDFPRMPTVFCASGLVLNGFRHRSSCDICKQSTPSTCPLLLRGGLHGRACFAVTDVRKQQATARANAAGRLVLSCAQTQETQSGQGPDISLLETRLQLTWDHKKNAHLGDLIIKPYSNLKVWWQCDKCPQGHPHEWQAQVRSRSTSAVPGSGCPFCAGKAVCSHNSLATLAPHIALDWDFAANKLTPKDHVGQTHEQACWRCHACGHEWEASIHHRVSANSGCPECYARRRRCKPDGTRSRHLFLAQTDHPMMAQFDHARNAQYGLDWNKITCGSNKLVHWICHKCPMGHTHRWTVSPHRRSYGSTGCPYCSCKKACQCNCLQTHCPEIAAEWDHSRNECTPSDYLPSSVALVWWKATDRPSWQQTIASRTKRTLNRARQAVQASNAAC